jgi:hypothetical protein
MIAFIDDHRATYGVEPICRVLPIAPSTYHAHAARRADAGKLSARARRDMALKVEVRRVFDESFQVYGVRKVWRQLQREGQEVARCTVARIGLGPALFADFAVEPTPSGSVSLVHVDWNAQKPESVLALNHSKT